MKNLKFHSLKRKPSFTWMMMLEREAFQLNYMYLKLENIHDFFLFHHHHEKFLPFSTNILISLYNREREREIFRRNKKEEKIIQQRKGRNFPSIWLKPFPSITAYTQIYFSDYIFSNFISGFFFSNLIFKFIWRKKFPFVTDIIFFPFLFFNTIND